MKTEPEKLLSLEEVKLVVRKSRAQIYRDVRAGKLPAPIECGPNSIAWLASEIAEWQASRPRRTYGGAGEPARTA